MRFAALLATLFGCSHGATEPVHNAEPARAPGPAPATCYEGARRNFDGNIRAFLLRRTISAGGSVVIEDINVDAKMPERRSFHVTGDKVRFESDASDGGSGELVVGPTGATTMTLVLDPRGDPPVTAVETVSGHRLSFVANADRAYASRDEAYEITCAELDRKLKLKFKLELD